MKSLGVCGLSLLEGCRAPLRERCRLTRRIIFGHLVVNLLGFIRLLPRFVEAGEFKLRRRLADNNRRLIDQLLIEIDRLRVFFSARYTEARANFPSAARSEFEDPAASCKLRSAAALSFNCAEAKPTK